MSCSGFFDQLSLANLNTSRHVGSLPLMSTETWKIFAASFRKR